MLFPENDSLERELCKKYNYKTLSFIASEHRQRVNAISSIIPSKPGKVLDVGCGSGVYSILSAEKGAKAISGIDVDPKAVAKARVWASEKKLRVANFEKKDFLKLPENEKFDLIIASEVLEHLPSISAGLKKVHSLLSPHGKAVISLPNSSSLFWLLFHAGQKAGAVERPEKLGREHHHEIPLQEIRALLEENDLKVLHEEGVMFFPFPAIYNFLPRVLEKPLLFLGFFWEKIDSFLGKTFLKDYCSSVIFVVQKKK